MKTMACVVAVALMLGGIESEGTTAAELPNIVFIISDDHDPAQLGFLDNPFVHTPSPILSSVKSFELGAL